MGVMQVLCCSQPLDTHFLKTSSLIIAKLVDKRLTLRVRLWHSSVAALNPLLDSTPSSFALKAQLSPGLQILWAPLPPPCLITPIQIPRTRAHGTLAWKGGLRNVGDWVGPGTAGFG